MWNQGEHVAIIGDTGSGKSFLETRLLQRRGAVLVLRTKSDPEIVFDGFETVTSIRQVHTGQFRYVLDTSRFPRAKQKLECERALEYVWRAGRWCVAVDELFYASERLRLAEPIERLLTQGRSPKITVVCGMQRPSRITRFAIAEAKHVFCFSLEGRDAKTVRDATVQRMEEAIHGLKQYQFAYFNRVNKQITVAKAQQLDKVI